MNKKKFNLTYFKNNNFKNSKNKISILCLENYFFHSFIMEVENIINEEDRIEKIEDRLEGIFTEYDSSKYLLRYEKIKENKKGEKLVVYLLDLDLLEENSIIESMSKNYKKFISIVPSFLICREFKQSSNFFNFDVSEKNIVISKYTSNILEDISFYQLLTSSNKENFEEGYSNIINTYLDSIDTTYDIVFTGEKINNHSLMLENRSFYNFETEKFSLNSSPNFLPDNLKNLYIYFYSNQKNILILFIFSLFLLISSVFLNYKINEINNIFVDIQIKNSNLEDKIINIREEISEIEKSKIFLEKEVQKNKINNLKLNFLLDFLSGICEEIKIKSLESDKNSIINIVGTSYESKNIIKFLKKIEESKSFELINYDYIMTMNKNNIFEFKAEIKYRE